MASSTFSGSPVTVTQLGSGAPLCGKRMSTWKEHAMSAEDAREDSGPLRVFLW
jgi:hypothetical protein